MQQKLKIIDLFCGVGGLSYGFTHKDEYEIIAANEILPNMAQAYLLNHPKVKMVVGDIKDFNRQKVEKSVGVSIDTVDIIIGGPPCQAYSTVGKRLADDPRGRLFQEYYRVLQEFQPSFFLFENVKGLLSMQGGKLLMTIMALFESLGYRVQYKLLNAADFGAPQIRERIIVVGTRLKNVFYYPSPTHYNQGIENIPALFNSILKPYLSLEDAISDLPFVKSGEERFDYASEPHNGFQRKMRIGAPERLMDHNSPRNSAWLVKLMETLPDGGTPEDLPEEMRPTSGFKNTYCRLWWKRPSTTITRNLGTPSSSRCIHPKAARPLTTREGARIQCFPDSYRFYGTRSDRNLQIGNAVPTVLSTALADAILSHFKREYTEDTLSLLHPSRLHPFSYVQ